MKTRMQKMVPIDVRTGHVSGVNPTLLAGDADFNCDDLIAVDDLVAIIRNFDMEGDA